MLERQAGPLARSLARRALARPRARWSLAVLGALIALAAGADLLASDLPLLLHMRGQLHVLPCVVRPAGLRALDNQRIAAQLTNDQRALQAQTVIDNSGTIEELEGRVEEAWRALSA